MPQSSAPTLGANLLRQKPKPPWIVLMLPAGATVWKPLTQRFKTSREAWEQVDLMQESIPYCHFDVVHQDSWPR